MQLNQDVSTDDIQVQSYQPGELKINNELYHRSVIVTPKQLIEDWRPQCFEDITSTDLEPLLALSPDVIILGTGMDHHFIQPELCQAFMQAGKPIECMETSAACRTFMVLASEGRQVAAALLLK